MPTQFARLGDRDAGQLLDQLWRGIFPNARDRRLRINAFLRYANSLGPERGAINYFSHRYFLQKQLKLTMARATAKSTLVAGVTAVDRTAQTASGIDSACCPAWSSAAKTARARSAPTWAGAGKPVRAPA